MKDSVTYQLVVEEGRAEVRAVMARSILRIGCAKLGEPDAFVRSFVEGIRNVDRLAALNERLALGDFASWEDLLK